MRLAIDAMSQEWGLDASEQWLAEWSASIDERASQAQKLANKVATLSASHRSADGEVAITVSASGQVVDLKFSERIRDRSPDELARLVMATIRQAQARLTQLARQAAEETVGADSATGEAVVASFSRQFPQQPEDDRRTKPGG
ncbi:MAG TPA: YbaB/EbfC family nucleoid-associated protein [Candidatus Limnocylindrales bacterium]|nr:YbaB/EbfC family nucleoid-associated protein [Candidatus Limnocylindrales bacterium]